VDDQIQDGNQPYNIITGGALSADLNYNGLNPDDVALVNDDNDTAGILVTPGPTAQTSEAGSQATFTVVLKTQPTSNVTIPISSTRPTEGAAAPAQLVFTPTPSVVGGWNVAQTVTVTGQDDRVNDGNQPYAIRVGPATSMDALYNTATGSDVNLTNVDNDTAGIVVTALTPLTTTEAGGTARFSIVLTSQPVNTVVIPIASTKPSEGIPNPTVVAFNPTDYTIAQVVTVTGQDDMIADGNQPYSIVSDLANPQLGIQAQSSGSDGYNGLSVAGVQLTNQDDEPMTALLAAPGANCSSPGGALTCDTSNGGSATFTLRLATQPIANVTVTVTGGSGEANLAGSPITFTATAGSWNVPASITLTGLDTTNPMVRNYSIAATATSADPGYNNLIANVQGVNNPPASLASLVLSAGSGCTGTTAISCDTTNGARATFNVALATQPANDVTVSIQSSAPAEGTPNPASITFTSTTWNVPVAVQVTGQDTSNASVVAYQVNLSAAAAAGNPYNGKMAAASFTNGAIAPPPNDGGVDSGAGD
jgi:hypothetical protein